MRYHTYKGSHCRNLVIADSQGKELRFPNYNILSLPGGTIATVLDFLPPKDKFDTIVLFIGRNNAFNNQTPSTPPPREIARELSLQFPTPSHTNLRQLHQIKTKLSFSTTFSQVSLGLNIRLKAWIPMKEAA